MTLFFTLKYSSFGHVLVAQSQTGICAIMFGDEPETLVLDLQNQYPQAELVAADKDHECIATDVISLIEDPFLKLNLTLDVQGTVFQQQVWHALQTIPPGKTATYNEIAQQIDSPGAVRAVANACAANKLAAVIPCHRVIRKNGSISGYRWGVERKRQLLARESRRTDQH